MARVERPLHDLSSSPTSLLFVSRPAPAQSSQHGLDRAVVWKPQLSGQHLEDRLGRRRRLGLISGLRRLTSRIIHTSP